MWWSRNDLDTVHHVGMIFFVKITRVFVHVGVGTRPYPYIFVFNLPQRQEPLVHRHT